MALSLRKHFKREEWLEILGRQRAAQCEARRERRPFTELTEVHGTRALVPLYELGEVTRWRKH